MSVDFIAYGLIIFTVFLGMVTFMLLSRFTNVTRDKVYGISITVSTIPVCTLILVLVYQINPRPNWLWLIIALLPLTGYFVFPAWYRKFFLSRNGKRE